MPAELATSMIDWPVCSEDFTASSEEMVARSFWAMAQIAPLSFALATCRPVETMFWAVCELLAGVVEVLERDKGARIGVDAKHAWFLSRCAGVVLTAEGVLPIRIG